MDLEKYLRKRYNLELLDKDTIQSLWSGYGEISRVTVLDQGQKKSIVVKHIALPSKANHPRGWATDNSHKRKVKSYRVEEIWYEKYAKQTNEKCRVPQCIGFEKFGDESFLVLEDLFDLGLTEKAKMRDWDAIESGLKWLANFHGAFMNQELEGLWKNGTYWHLDTRPDELKALADTNLRKAAGAIDLKLKKAKYKTIVHGDAKLDNFCFDPKREKVAAVDFQYIGMGCGMKDVAYFLGSCLYEEECESNEEFLLNVYFTELKAALKNSDIDSNELINEWRDLYYWAWADFHRFLKGWSPGHWKINSYSEKICARIIENCRK